MTTEQNKQEAKKDPRARANEFLDGFFKNFNEIADQKVFSYKDKGVEKTVTVRRIGQGVLFAAMLSSIMTRPEESAHFGRFIGCGTGFVGLLKDENGKTMFEKAVRNIVGHSIDGIETLKRTTKRYDENGNSYYADDKNSEKPSFFSKLLGKKFREGK